MIPEGDDLLADAIPGYRLAFALVGVGVTAVLAIEHITIAIIARGHKNKHKHRPLSTDEHKHVQDPLPSSDFSEFSHGSRGIEQLPIDHDHGHGHDAGHEHGDECNGNEEEDHHHSRHGRFSVASHNHGLDVLEDISKAHSLKDFVALYALELSVSVHSIILGVDYGLETKSSTLLALTVALTFHQTIEGIAMGAAVVNMKDAMSDRKIMTFMIFFASTISIGVIIGIISSYRGESGAADTLQGIFSSLAAGSLLYVSLSEQVSTYFGRADLEDQLGTKLMMIAAFGLGFAAMAGLAVWE